MDLTGSIASFTAPLSMEIGGSLGASIGGGTGSSAIDTLLEAAFLLPNMLLGIIGAMGADLGSSTGMM